MKIVKLFCSVYVTVALLALYGILCAVATFIEADAAYGTSAAQDLIYRTAFFNIVHFLLLLNFVQFHIYRPRFINFVVIYSYTVPSQANGPLLLSVILCSSHSISHLALCQLKAVKKLFTIN